MKKTFFLFLLALASLCSQAQTNRFNDSTVFNNAVNIRGTGKNFYYKKGAVAGYVLSATDTNGKAAWIANPRDTSLTGILDSGQTYTIGKNTVVNPGDFVGSIVLDSLGTITRAGYVSNVGFLINQEDTSGNQLSISLDVNREVFSILYDTKQRPQFLVNPEKIYWECDLGKMVEFNTDSFKLGFYDQPPVSRPSITNVQYLAMTTGEKLLADRLILLGLLRRD